jgi:hypothetical protein
VPHNAREKRKRSRGSEHTNQTKVSGEDDIEIVVGKGGERAYAALLLSCDEGRGARIVDLERWEGAVEIAAAVELDRAGQFCHSSNSHVFLPPSRIQPAPHLLDSDAPSAVASSAPGVSADPTPRLDWPWSSTSRTRYSARGRAKTSRR